jgi:hypothetical protein
MCGRPDPRSRLFPIENRTFPHQSAKVRLIPDQEGFPIHPQNLEITENSPRERGTRQIPAVEVEFVRQVEALLSNSTLYAHLVRWAVEVRQRGLREAKKRVIPSLRGRREDDGEDFSIQLKPKFRQ